MHSKCGEISNSSNFHKKKNMAEKKQLNKKNQFYAGQWDSVSLKHPHHGGLGQTVSRCGGIIRVRIQRDKQNDALNSEPISWWGFWEEILTLSPSPCTSLEVLVKWDYREAIRIRRFSACWKNQGLVQAAESRTLMTWIDIHKQLNKNNTRPNKTITFL